MKEKILEILDDCLFDVIDVDNTLSKEVKDLPKDNEGTETSVGDCLDNIQEKLGRANYLIQQIKE